MARYLLGATMYVEDVLRRDDWSLEETENVKKYFKNVKSFKIPKIEKRKAEEFDEPCRKRCRVEKEKFENDLQAGIRLMTLFAGFEEIDEKALERLTDLAKLRIITSARQMAIAQRRRKDGFEIPFKSPVEWTLKLQGVQKVLDIKEWYDVTYWTRFRALKMQLIDENGDLKSPKNQN
ncbi:uncharacterized protein CELE_F28F8.9 [Caenorhabditis elegans]|nr:Uncharacterized protein CELE_F28F8.9 [Caenorhabditis elegans]CAI79242.1 Uncharacterized protein CELE_F28F8.9 [Caenorhabditis elegans]|eukprot:NP_001256676.1 Uncharacterized protein CELE_F28F8.9 [Caenorhabditis elegans]